MSATKEILVGLVFFAGVFILGTLTVVYGGIHLLRPPRIILAEFETVSGLLNGNKVRVAGLDVGTVRSMDLQQDRVLVALDLNVAEPIVVHEDYSIIIKPFSPFGGKYVEFNLGEKDRPVVPMNPDTVLKGRTSGEIVDRVNDLLERNADAFTDIVSNLAVVTRHVSQGEGSVGRLLFRDELYNEVLSLMVDARDAVNRLTGVLTALDSAGGTFDRLLHDPKLYDQTTELTGNLNTLLAGVNEGEGTVGQLVKNRALYDNALGLMDDLSTTLGRVQQLLDVALTADGSLYMFLSDGTLYRELADTATAVRGLVRDVEVGSGSLGRLWKDETLYEQLTQTLTKLEGVLEDYRETAPIQTVWGAVFSAF